MLAKSDAFVNTVDVNHPFEYEGDRSSSNDIVKNVGLREIKKQLTKSKNLKKGEFVMLEHPNLSAPISYHIMFYDDGDYSLDGLRNGIISVLNDATKKGLKSLGFIALGYEYVNRALPEVKSVVAMDIANCIAETIVTYFIKNKNKQLPEIHFNFVTVITMMAFDRAFFYWCSMDKRTIAIMNQVSELEHELISQSKTQNPAYIGRIKNIAYCVREKTSILLLGETGVGKTHLARVIHDNSSVASNRFVEINCAAMRGGNLHPELFGWVKGSFTDAIADGIGAVEVAEGGTLFLDEIGHMSLDVQKMLLTFIESGVYYRYGERGVERQSHVRIILGTNQDMQNLIDNNLFIYDLYQRIAQETLTIPALRERPEDTIQFINYFMEELAKTSGRKITISADAVTLLMKYKWPGNVRQLKIYVENLFNYAKYKQMNEITQAMIESNPPSNNLNNGSSPLLSMEKLLLQMLKSWNIDNGKFLDNVLGPVLAKVYIEDFEGKRKEAGKFIGIDGTRGTDSKLEEYYSAYATLKDTML
jgi:DNA-binding NtrC family response regulator